MTAAIKDLLELFDQLSESEKRDVLVAIIRRLDQLAYGPLSDEALTTLADERFRELDAEEAVHGQLSI